ncbi:MAG: shikimate kinase [Christensenellales bacterium]|jgi:shikimate kinase
MYRQNIAVIGLFTAFNAETARVIADEFELLFLEANKYLEWDITYSIQEIIKDFGEEYFIKCEAKTYKALSEFTTSSIGASATALINKDNIVNLRKSSYIVMLTAGEQITKRRLSLDPENYMKEYFLRDYDNIIKKINEEIVPLCDIIINTDFMTPVKAAKRVEGELKKLIFGAEV